MSETFKSGLSPIKVAFFESNRSLCTYGNQFLKIIVLIISFALAKASFFVTTVKDHKETAVLGEVFSSLVLLRFVPSESVSEQ